jgi:hypothetical protein
VHSPLVLDVEVAHGATALVDDREAQPLGPAAPQLGLIHDDTKAVIGHRQASNRLPRVGARLANSSPVGLTSAVVAPRALPAGGVRTRIGVAICVDRSARKGRATEDQPQNGGEAGESGRRAHDAIP